MEFLEEKLLSDRLLLPINSGFYKQIETFYNIMLKRFDDIPKQYHPKLVVCQSANKHISISKIRGDDTFYLIFDLQFIDSVFHLSLLNNDTCTLDDLHSFVYRTIAENYLCQGMLNHSKDYINKYLQTPSSNNYHNTNVKAQANHFIIYEAFIILHELSHWFSFRISNEEKEKIDRHRKACLDIFTRYLKSVEKKGDDNVNLFIQKQVDYITQNDKIVEESYCDMLATNVVMDMWGENSLFDTADNVLLALRYVQFIQNIGFFTSIVDFGQEEDVSFFDMNIRCIIQNAYLNNYIRKNYPSELNVYYSIYMKASDDYGNRIENPLIHMMGDLQNNSDRLNNEKEIEFFEEGYNELFEKIKSILYGID